jgi:transposase
MWPHNGSRLRRFRSVPLGCRRCSLEMAVRRLTCKDCGEIAQEEVDFAKGKRRHTQFFANMVIDLSRFATIQDISWFLDVSWNVVRNIQMEFLRTHYSSPDLSNLEYVSMDEFAVHKGQVYKTIAIDLKTGRIVYVGDGHGKESLNGFWGLLGDNKHKIKAVCTDMSSAFTGAVMESLPNAALVIDHFHVRKLMNEKLDQIRRQVVHAEKDVNKRKVIKGTRWLLLRNGEDIFDAKYANRLENALSLNEPLMKAHYLKEDLREIWNQRSKEDGEKVLNLWIGQARDTKLRPLMVMANTLSAFGTAILAWYDCPISNGPIEGTNNKIKVLKRQAYGFRDDEFFTLKLYALHDKRLRI